MVDVSRIDVERKRRVPAIQIIEKGQNPDKDDGECLRDQVDTRRLEHFLKFKGRGFVEEHPDLHRHRLSPDPSAVVPIVSNRPDAEENEEMHQQRVIEGDGAESLRQKSDSEQHFENRGKNAEDRKEGNFERDKIGQRSEEPGKFLVEKIRIQFLNAPPEIDRGDDKSHSGENAVRFVFAAVASISEQKKKKKKEFIKRRPDTALILEKEKGKCRDDQPDQPFRPRPDDEGKKERRENGEKTIVDRIWKSRNEPKEGNQRIE